MTSADDREARIAMAMLPIGATVMVVSVLALLTVVALAMTAPFDHGAGWGWTELWCLVAAIVAARNGRAGIEVMGAFDWRPLPGVALLSAAVVAGWLILP